MFQKFHAESENNERDTVFRLMNYYQVPYMAVLVRCFELELLEEYILEGKDISSNEKIEKHAAWVAEFLPKYDNLDKDNIQDVLRKEVGNVFVHVLEDAGVYKCTAEGREAFMRFINKL